MITWTRVRYRITQFFRTLWTWVQPIDTAYADSYLTPELRQLFRHMPRVEQHHGIDVCRKLETQGYTGSDLLIAALLHDVGKTKAPLRIWERVIAVLGEHFVPELTERWSRGEPRGLRRSFVTRRMHPQWGVKLAQQAGASNRTVELIERHHTAPNQDIELQALQIADE